MSIKRIFIVISAIFAASTVFADNSSVTSKKYVDDLMSGYQGKLPGSGANTLMIYDDEAGIGEKSIETTLVSNATGVPTVGAVKTGLDGVQDTITGTAGYVMTGTGTPGEVGERAIYSADTNYSDALVTAETVNTGVINAVNNSLRRVNENGDLDSNGTLWEINTSLLALSVLGYLPDGYTKLEYIESDGARYIDTGVVMTNTTGIKIEVDDTSRLSPKAGTAAYFVGTQTSAKYMGYFTRDTQNLGLTSVWAWNGEGVIGYNIQTTRNTVYINYQNDRQYRYNEHVAVATLPTLEENQLSLYLFAVHMRSGLPDFYSKGKIYSVKITDGSTLIRDFVPVSKVENNTTVVGMYDVINGVFYAGTGSGSFSAGPSVGN